MRTDPWTPDDSMIADLAELAAAAVDHARVPVVASLYSRGRLEARSPADRARLSPLDHAEITLLRGMGYRIRTLRKPIVLLTTVRPCAMCLAAARIGEVDVIGYVLPDPDDTAGPDTGDDTRPVLLRLGHVERFRAEFKRFAVTCPDSRDAASVWALLGGTRPPAETEWAARRGLGAVGRSVRADRAAQHQHGDLAGGEHP